MSESASAAPPGMVSIYASMDEVKISLARIGVPKPSETWQQLYANCLALADEDVWSVFYCSLPLLKISIVDVLNELQTIFDNREEDQNSTNLGLEPALLPLLQKHRYLVEQKEARALLRSCVELGDDNKLMIAMFDKVFRADKPKGKPLMMKTWTTEQLYILFGKVIRQCETETLTMDGPESAPTIPWCVQGQVILQLTVKNLYAQDIAEDADADADATEEETPEVPPERIAYYTNEAKRVAQKWLDAGLFLNVASKGDPENFSDYSPFQLTRRGKNLLMGGGVNDASQDVLNAGSLLVRLFDRGRTPTASRNFSHVISKNDCIKHLKAELKQDNGVLWHGLTTTFSLFALCEPFYPDSEMYYVTVYGQQHLFKSSVISGPTSVISNDDASMRFVTEATEASHGGAGTRRRKNSPLSPNMRALQSEPSSPEKKTKKKKKIRNIVSMTRSRGKQFLERRKSINADKEPDLSTLERKVRKSKSEIDVGDFSFLHQTPTASVVNGDSLAAAMEASEANRTSAAAARPETEWINFATCDVTKLAEQLTLRMWQIYRNVTPADFVGQPWREQGDHGEGLRQLSTISNNITDWLATEVLLCIYPGIGPRHIIARAITLGDKFLELHNFQGLMAVSHALHKHPVDRLTPVWESLKEKSKSAWEAIKQVTSPYSSFKNYRAALGSLRSNRVTTIPFSGVCQQDVTFIEEGNNTRQDDGTINWGKCVMLEKEIMLYVADSMAEPPSLVEDDAWKQWWDNERLVVSDDILDAQSSKVVPRPKH